MSSQAQATSGANGPPTTGAGGPPTGTSFDAADTDKDGVVSRTEAGVISGLDFPSADADHNSTLDREEFTIAMAATDRPPG